MSSNRNKKYDIEITKQHLLNKYAVKKDPSWLDHKGKGAIIDYLLLKGYSKEQLVKKSGRKESSVLAHIYHLKTEHGLLISNKNSKFKIEFQLEENIEMLGQTKEFLSVDIPINPPLEVRFLVAYMLENNSPKTIKQLTADIRKKRQEWKNSKNLERRIGRSLENTPEIILNNDIRKGEKSKQSRIFSIYLQYRNVKVNHSNGKFFLKLTKGNEPQIRTTDFTSNNFQKTNLFTQAKKLISDYFSEEKNQRIKKRLVSNQKNNTESYNEQVIKESNSTIKKLSKDKLKLIFINDIKSKFNVKDSKNNPFQIHNNKTKESIWIFLKNISPAYFENKDITRIQIAKTPAFVTLKNNNEICIPIGFDAINNSYVVWNPWLFTQRINEKENISIYSRLEIQQQVKLDMYMPFFLSSGEKVYAVNEIFISKFLSEIEKYFNDMSPEIIPAYSFENINNIISEKSTAIEQEYKKAKEESDRILFVTNKEYKKTDIYTLLDVPEEQRNGKWDKGYCRHNNTHFIFANVGMAGKGYENNSSDKSTYDYNNKFDSNGNFEWEAANGSKIDWPSIKELKKSKPFIFIRLPSTTPKYWKYIGVGKCLEFRNTTPVYFKWKINGLKSDLKIKNQPSISLKELRAKNEISPRAYSVCWSNGIYNIDELLIYYRQNESFSGLSNCGKKTCIELIKTCVNFNPINLKETDAVKIKKIATIIENLDSSQIQMIDSFIKLNASNLSVRSRNAINLFLNGDLNIKGFEKKIIKNQNFAVRQIKNAGPRSIPELNEFISDIKSFIMEVSEENAEKKFYASNNLPQIKVDIDEIVSKYSSSTFPKHILEDTISQIINKNIPGALKRIIEYQTESNPDYSIIQAHEIIENIRKELGLNL